MKLPAGMVDMDIIESLEGGAVSLSPSTLFNHFTRAGHSTVKPV